MGRTPIARGSFAAVALALLVIAAPPARADAPSPSRSSWGAELGSVAEWLRAQGPTTECKDHCFVLTRLHLTGMAGGTMGFTLEGAVLADRPTPVPLFGSPTNARVDGATENGKPAAVGFEGDHWFVVTPPGRFTVAGKLTLKNDLVLGVPGPLDVLDADLSSGRLVEGARLSGLTDATVHFDKDESPAPAAEAPVFQLSRAVRVGRETTFEYQLVLRSGTDLGVAKLPLSFGEKVLDVRGSEGWSVQGAELVLPTAGRTASIGVTGTLPSVGHFEPDPRSAYEWWLIESDVEHRTGVTGDAPQVDASESPLGRTQASSRLFLVGRGQHLDVAVQALVATDALAAVVQQHNRRLVLTATGDLVADDQLTYENNGIDWLAWPPTGRAVFLGTDGRSERVMRAASGDNEVLVPLRVGTHTARVQSMSTAAIGIFGGWLSLPAPAHALVTSRATVTLGLPSGVRPLVVVGGDKPWLALRSADAIAFAVSIGVALAGLSGRARRIVGAFSLGGLWLVSATAWEALMGVAGLVFAAWLAVRLLPRSPRALALGALGVTVVGAAVLVGVPRGATHMATSLATLPLEEHAKAFEAGDMVDHTGQVDAPAAALVGRIPAQDADKEPPTNALGQTNARRADGGIVQGVAPVALPLPAYERSVSVTRELVTRDRPLSLGLFYMTTAGLAPLFLAWLMCVALLVRLHAANLARGLKSIRERLMREPEPVAAPPPMTA